jgi:SAM-dependent methyltransferase
MKQEVLPEYDPDGEKTLEVISGAHNFNQWMFRTVVPFCTGEILELGSGIGNISGFFLDQGYTLTLSDLRPSYIRILEKKFAGYPNLRSVIPIDLIDPGFENKFSSMADFFDTVFALNVIEHIENHHLAVRHCRFLLKKGGKLIILVPAYQFLYNRFDKNLGHYRRYTASTLNELLLSAGFDIIHHQYFNLAGILGWFLSGRIMKKETIPGNQMNLYNKLVPIFKWTDKLAMNKAGLSVISVGLCKK